MTEPANVLVETSTLPLLVRLGFNPLDVLRHAGLPLEMLSQPTAHLTVSQFRALWVALETLAPDPTFPIHLGRHSVSGGFHAIAFAGLCASNLKAAMARVRDYKRLIAPESLELQEDQGEFTVVWRWDDAVARMPASQQMMSAVFITELARVGTRSMVTPVRVVLSAPAPQGVYDEYFGVAPELGQQLSVCFRDADATKPFLTVNDSMWAIFEPGLQQRMSRLGVRAPAAVRVRELLLECLPAGVAGIATVAERMGLSRRTLQRELAGEGLVYQQVLRQVRGELSEHYLCNTELSYGEIALLVGYDETSSFFRAFKRWTGKTPDKVRRAKAAARVPNGTERAREP
ncbi:MAG: AraC family transcriptional regulator [Bryobacterales bacterium]|jgi:AraC-like DNA-binding protein|nr:AraC family transcriptional regulator [Bryobacterales bacterium]